ncbi:phospholipase D-like domain-containing protein [Myxococcaceae bacterium GXIMD 01537]
MKRFGRWLLWLAVLLVGCPYPNHRHDLRVRSLPGTDPETVSLAFYQSTGVALEPGNEVALVENGHVFDAMVEDIAAARSSIHIISYIWRPEEPSDRLVQALARRQPGVVCRILVDPLGSVHFEQVQPRLVAAGCEVRIFRPLTGAVASLDLARVKGRLHRKLMVRDGAWGLTGGWGIYKSWLGESRTADEWRDVNVRVHGPAVRGMQQVFAQSWQEAGGAFLPAEAFPALEPVGPARAGFIGSNGAPILSNGRRMTMMAIGAARHRLWIANSYFIPSQAISDMLILKAREGVDVRVLVPGRHHDIAPVHAAQRASYARLLEGGVRIWEYELSMMHAKTMLADESLSVIGSTNMDPLSLSDAEEGSLVVDDPVLAARLAEVFERDLTHSREIHWAGWKKRGLLERMGDIFPWLMGRQL